MKIDDLIKLPLDDLELELETESYSVADLYCGLTLEESGKNRKGAVELFEDAIEIASLEPEKYAIADGKAMRFKAGMKSNGDEVDPSWPEYHENKNLLAEHIERGLVVKK